LRIAVKLTKKGPVSQTRARVGTGRQVGKKNCVIKAKTQKRGKKDGKESREISTASCLGKKTRERRKGKRRKKKK